MAVNSGAWWYSGFVLKEKLKRIKGSLQQWHLNHTLNINSKIQDARDRMAVLDEMGGSNTLGEHEVNELHMLSTDIMAFSKLQASMQWQKSRLNWLKEGDATTNFFHGIMSSRKSLNSIISLSADGVQIDGVDAVRQTVFQHFHDHFQRRLHVRPTIGGLMFKSLSDTEGAALIKPFILEEIKAAIWDCDSYKCLGPDGINLGFFKGFWEVLKIDLLNFFGEFFLSWQVNDTLLIGAKS